MPRERPAHRARTPVQQAENDDEDLGIYEDEDDGVSSDADLPVMAQDDLPTDENDTEVRLQRENTHEKLEQGEKQKETVNDSNVAKSTIVTEQEEVDNNKPEGDTNKPEVVNKKTKVSESHSTSDEVSISNEPDQIEEAWKSSIDRSHSDTISAAAEAQMVGDMTHSQTEDEEDLAVRRVDIASAPRRLHQTPPLNTHRTTSTLLHQKLPNGKNSPVLNKPPSPPSRSVTLFSQDRLAIDTIPNSATSSKDLRSKFGVQSVPPQNTPSNEEEWTELRDLESRLTGADSRQASYDRAISLLKTSCSSQLLLPSKEKLMPAAGRCTQLGSAPIEFFYIRQEKPIPMPPLKAWRGFHGNVYFEPISVLRAPVAPPSDALHQSKSNPQQKNRDPSLNRSKTDLAYRQMSILDRNRVQRQSNTFLTEDLTWLHGQASTGSLRTQNSFERSKIPYNREKIIKGPVAKSAISRFNTALPLAVSGGRYYKPNRPSALIRSQTQYSNSNRRGSLPSIEAAFPIQTIQNPDTKALVHIIPTRTPPVKTTPVNTPTLIATPPPTENSRRVNYDYDEHARSGQAVT